MIDMIFSGIFVHELMDEDDTLIYISGEDLEIVCFYGQGRDTVIVKYTKSGEKWI